MMKKGDEQDILVEPIHCMGLFVTEWMKEALNRGTKEAHLWSLVRLKLSSGHHIRSGRVECLSNES